MYLGPRGSFYHQSFFICHQGAKLLSAEGGKKAVLAFFAYCETAKGSERALKVTKCSRRLPGGRQACSTGIYSQQVYAISVQARPSAICPPQVYAISMQVFISTCNSLAFAIRAIFHNKRYQYRGGSLFEGPSGEKEWPSEAKALLLGSGLGEPQFTGFLKQSWSKFWNEIW